MRADKREKEKIRQTLVRKIESLGYPREFGEAIAANLGGAASMSRMVGYLQQVKPGSAEEIADEMLAICSDRDRWIRKKELEYYNSRYNEMLNRGLGEEDADREE